MRHLYSVYLVSSKVCTNTGLRVVCIHLLRKHASAHDPSDKASGSVVCICYYCLFLDLTLLGSSFARVVDRSIFTLGM